MNELFLLTRLAQGLLALSIVSAIMLAVQFSLLA
jgi:hypothetical protein